MNKHKRYIDLDILLLRYATVPRSSLFLRDFASPSRMSQNYGRNDGKGMKFAPSSLFEARVLDTYTLSQHIG